MTRTEFIWWLEERIFDTYMDAFSCADREDRTCFRSYLQQAMEDIKVQFDQILKQEVHKAFNDAAWKET